jgi:hypothetical protein
MRLMILVLCLYIILMPRSLCVCVHLGVTFTLIFIINYYYYPEADVIDDQTDTGSLYISIRTGKAYGIRKFLINCYSWTTSAFPA